MRLISLVLSGILGIVIMSSVQAKTVIYDLKELHSNNGWVHYDGLDFNEATSAIITVTKTLPSPEITISSLVVNFPNAAKLTATNFKKIESGGYRAIVNGAWVYREVIVDIDEPTIQADFPIHVRVSVSERTAFINPVADIKGSPLLDLFGVARDITATKIVDTAATTINGKKVTLSLRDRLGFDDNHRFGFVINALWYGKGQKTLVVPWAAPYDIDFFDAIELTIDDVSMPTDPQVRIKFRDQRAGVDIFGPTVPLRTLLTEAYGPF